MGKSAGNTPLELLAHYLNRYRGKTYRIEEILDLIDQYVPLTLPQWGYSTFYFLAAATGCHPNYVAYLREQGLNSSAIYATLGKIPREKRLSYDEAYITRAYQEKKEGHCETIPL